ncbi:hypothetical protein [uncultured Methylobacterium sp.]|uniref:hypothetical protein n=1 Tax=uncultured Methylobacterium sp. TaxID=157278 RepID=UPI0035CC3364
MTQQQTQPMQPLAPGADYAERLVRNERDIAGLKEGVAALTNTVDRGFNALAADLKSRSSINWAPIGILVPVLGLIGSGFFAFLSSGQGRLEAMIAKQEISAERYVKREDIDARLAVLSQRRDDIQRLGDARVERIERDIDAVQKAVVPRGEHGEIWAGQRIRDEALQRQIDQVRKDVTDLNTPRDTVQGILRRLDDLDRRRTPG